MPLLRKVWAFLHRDFLSETSYKLAFLMQLAGIVLSALTLFFLSKILGRAVSPYLEPYGGDYFSFVLIGIAFASYLNVALSSFSSCIREAQVLGMLRRGHTTAAIADRLEIAPVTVRRHISELVHKLGVENRAALTAPGSRWRARPAPPSDGPTLNV